MNAMEDFAAVVSVEMGLGGEITDAVLKEATSRMTKEMEALREGRNRVEVKAVVDDICSVLRATTDPVKPETLGKIYKILFDVESMRYVAPKSKSKKPKMSGKVGHFIITRKST